MDLFKLKTDIQSKSISNFYIFAGEETGIMDIYVNQIAKVCNLAIDKLDTVSAVYERIKKPGLVSIDKLYVVMDDKSFMKTEKLWKLVPKVIKSNRLILIYTKLDKRSKFFKQNDYVPFNTLTPEVLSKYICKKLPISVSNAKVLAELCQCSYNRCLQEVDKVLSYLQYQRSIHNDMSPDMAFRSLLNSGAIYQPIGDITFEVVDAILNRVDVAKLERLMIQVRRKNEPRLLLLSLLYTRFRNLFIVKSLGNNLSNAESSSGLTKGQIGQARIYLDRYNIYELKRALDIIQQLEYGVKAGLVEEQFSVDYLIAEIV